MKSIMDLPSYTEQCIGRIAQNAAFRIEEATREVEGSRHERQHIIEVLVMDAIYTAHGGMVRMCDHYAELVHEEIMCSIKPLTIKVPKSKIRE